MTYKIVYSNQFKKSFKKCFKRGLDVEKLREILRILEKKVHSHLNIRLINFWANFKESGNVTFKPIGFLYGNRMTKS